MHYNCFVPLSHYKLEKGSLVFKQFLELLGETIDLLGWTNFKGGLDTRINSTGTTSVYTVFEGHEVMFHVSTMLPYSKENRQQVSWCILNLDNVNCKVSVPTFLLSSYFHLYYNHTLAISLPHFVC